MTIHSQALFCKRQSHKSLTHRQYITSLCCNFSSNTWWTSNKIQRFADLVSFVLSTWGNTRWNKPYICSSRMQVETCQHWIHSESGVPLSSITFDSKATHYGLMHWVMNSNGCCSTAKAWGLALLNKCEKCSHSHRKTQGRRPLCVLSDWNTYTLGLLLPVHRFR